MRKTVLISLLAAAAVLTCLAGCAGKNGDAKNSEATEGSAQSDNSLVSAESSEEKSTEAPSSEPDSPSEEPKPGESAPAESKPSESSSEESIPVESSDEEDGYNFDDEDIVEDYHTATVFTDDDDFNKLFAENDIDKAYNEEMKNPETIAEMRIVTEDYTRRWQQEAERAYEKLSAALADKPDESEKLAASQERWRADLEKTEQGFMREASGNGTYGMLSADSAMMNYYKGRTAVLYHQIYLLNGSFDMT